MRLCSNIELNVAKCTKILFLFNLVQNKHI